MANESYREYAFAAQLDAGEYAESLNWLADAASRAAFSSAELNSDETNAASGLATDLRSKIS